MKKNKIWYLSTCSTCKKIINELNIKEKEFEFYDLKENPIKKEELEEIQKKSHLSYEELFNKRAQKYTKTNLKEKLKSDNDFKEAILKEYTFLKRPIIKINNKYFIGNNKKVVEEAKKEVEK